MASRQRTQSARQRVRSSWIGALAAFGLLVGGVGVDAQVTISTADPIGDQLIFFFDARAGRIPFLNVSNPASIPVFLEVAFYGQALGGRLGQTTIILPGFANKVIDPTSAEFGSVGTGTVGLAIVTPVMSTTNSQPVVPSLPLVGNFTLANPSLRAAFGENAFGRLAVTATGARALQGRPVDGTIVTYQRLAPSTLAIPAHFNPTQLAIPANDGNRVILAAFSDQYGAPFQIAAATANLQAVFYDGAGAAVAATSADVNGIRLSNLQELAAPATLSSSGKVLFQVNGNSGNLLGIFSQSLATFASGQRMPALEGAPITTTTIEAPALTGDQLIFFFDARSQRTPFLNVSNPSATAVTVEVAFYGQALSARLGQTTITLAGFGNRVIDPTAPEFGGVGAGNVGLAVVTPVASTTDSQPMVPPLPLLGSFTLANQSLAAAFGENAFGRLAVTAAGARAPAGTPVDGTTVSYQRLTPSTLVIPGYFNPTQLAAPENDGNRVILAAFRDTYGSPFQIGAAAANVDAVFYDNAGALAATANTAVNGVRLASLQELAAPATLSSSGKVILRADGLEGNLLGLFSQSLGTFASGQRMPAIALVLIHAARQSVNNNPNRPFGPLTKNPSPTAFATMPGGELPDGPLVSGVTSRAFAGQSVACDQGNQRLEQCETIPTTDGGIASRSTIRFNACTTATSNGFIRQSGIIRVTIPSSTECIFYTRSQLPFGKEIREERLDFVSSFFDFAGNLTRQDTEQVDQLETFLNLCRGAAGEQFASNNRRQLGGTVEVLVADSGGTLRILQTYTNVSLTRLFSTNCAIRTTTFEGGTLQVEDARFNERYVNVYDDLNYVLATGGSAGSTLSLDGTLTSSDCSNTGTTTFGYRTLEAPTFDATDPNACPRGGAFEIASGATVVGQIVFTSGGGIQLIGAGGQSIEYASCNDPALISTCGP